MTEFSYRERPVTSTGVSRGISREIFFRLCTRAPRTAIVVRGAARAGISEGIAALFHVNERELLYFDIALLREMRRYRDFADNFLVHEILARQRDSFDPEVSSEVIFDLDARPRFAGLAQMINHGTEQRACAARHVVFNRLERGLNGFLRFFRIEQVRVNRFEETWIHLDCLRYHLPVGEHSC